MLITLLEVPNTQELLAYWAAQHQDQHRLIRNALLGQVEVPDYILDPIPKDTKVWAEQHQVLHSKICAATNVSTRDLRSIDFSNKEQLESWIEFHFDEHREIAEALGING